MSPIRNGNEVLEDVIELIEWYIEELEKKVCELKRQLDEEE